MKSPKPTSIRMEFEDNGTLALLTGEHNANLAQLEQALDVSLDSFGNSITTTGADASSSPSEPSSCHSPAWYCRCRASLLNTTSILGC